tara:strand:+ start:2000 stop:2305 length:306 start_codon:yes stop_codon:yes gene_type:complete
MRLDLPLAGERRIRIGSHEWLLRFVDSIETDGDCTTHGVCESSTRTITVARIASESWVLSTLLHEVMHAIEHTYEVRIRHQDLNLFADILAGVLIDNWRTE